MTNADKSRRDGIFIRFRTLVVFPPDARIWFFRRVETPDDTPNSRNKIVRKFTKL